MKPRHCPHCRNTFTPKKWGILYCDDCAKGNRSNRIKRRDEHTCINCGQPGYCLTHIVPRSALDANGTYGNLAVACSKCNAKYRKMGFPNAADLLALVSERNQIHGYSDSQLLWADAPAQLPAIPVKDFPVFRGTIPPSELASRALYAKTRRIAPR